MTGSDPWARWLLERRFGGDEGRLQAVLDSLYPVRDKVLAHAALAGDETLLDVGCGDGLIGFGALDALPEGRVIFSDISQDLLDHTRTLAADMDVIDRCDFLRADAASLAGLADESVDVVTTRSVLIYVAQKRAAFAAFYRVLKPGGTFSLFEPVNRFGWPEPPGVLWGYDVTPVREIAAKVKAVYNAIQPPGDPMFDFDAYDLLDMAEAAGFREVHLELLADVLPFAAYGLGGDWEAVVTTAPNPRVPTFEEAMEQALSDEERDRLTAHLRPLVEAGQGTLRRAVAYVWGEK